jgi:hypothetical protein
LEKALVRIVFDESPDGFCILHNIGRIEAASAWHAENSLPPQQNWRDLILHELIRKAEEVDADAVVDVKYRSEPAIRIEETGVALKRIVASGMAVKLALAA